MERAEAAARKADAARESPPASVAGAAAQAAARAAGPNDLPARRVSATRAPVVTGTRTLLPVTKGRARPAAPSEADRAGSVRPGRTTVLTVIGRSALALAAGRSAARRGSVL